MFCGQNDCILWSHIPGNNIYPGILDNIYAHFLLKIFYHKQYKFWVSFCIKKLLDVSFFCGLYAFVFRLFYFPLRLLRFFFLFFLNRVYQGLLVCLFLIQKFFSIVYRNARKNYITRI